MSINQEDCPIYLRDFLFYMKVVKGRGDRTVEAYYIDLRLFLRYLKYKKLNMPEDTNFNKILINDVPVEYIKEFTLNDAYQFLYFISDKRSNTSVTRARKASSLKMFYKYLTVNSSYIDKNPIKDLELPSLKKSLPKYLSLEDSISLLQTVENYDSDRDYCIITLFLNCGMRLSELVGINLMDIDLNNNTLRLLGKGNKERIVYLNGACINALNTYLKSRTSTKEKDALFISRNNTRISTRRVQQIVDTYLKASGVYKEGLSTHKLRHTAATLMYQHGNVDTLVLKELLGHKSIATTEIYTHVSNESLKKAASSTPISNIKKTTKKQQD